MRWGVGVLLVMTLPAWAGEPPPGCAWLCGSWTVDTAASESPETIVDAALARNDGPPTLRPELLAALASPPTLTLAEQGNEILIRVPGQPDRRLTANRSHTRVDSNGTADIRAKWGSDDALQITESYGRRRSQGETYALQRDGTLVITREVERPGIKRAKVRWVYRRS
jgi:hypothetical protein